MAVGEVRFKSWQGGRPADCGGFNAAQAELLGAPGNELIQLCVVRERVELMPGAETMRSGAARRGPQEREAYARIDALLIIKELAEQCRLDRGAASYPWRASAFVGSEPARGGNDRTEE